MLTPLREIPFPARLRHFWSKLKHSSLKTFALLFAVGLSLSLIVSACTPTQPTNITTSPTSATTSVASSQPQQSNVIRIGYQKYGTLSILKSRGSLEKRLVSQNTSVQWLQFPAGPQLLEALNTGSIDFGHTGEAPPIFAQAAGAPLVYVANEPPNPKGEAILVPKDSPIQNVAGLKGKKVVFNKGSNVQYLVVEALTAAGLKYSDIQPIYLPPAEARAAFEQGSVDAWAIWDPFFTVAKRATGARVLKDGEGLVANREFYLAAKPFNDQYPDRTKAILEELQKVDEWAAAQPTEVAKLLSPELGIDVPALEEISRRRPYGVQPITDEVITYQQKVADTFLDLKLLPKPVKISEVAQVVKQ
ncbi:MULTISPECIES: sulfonate ABC transporter substrate-binding protein [unclassified Microcoleus]|uniref:sulfonate ABC transporter substrate-binding protein n=1 Tax=unclassified Microcoleus TaxID=2642155 RepID=UPI002FCFCBCB